MTTSVSKVLLCVIYLALQVLYRAPVQARPLPPDSTNREHPDNVANSKGSGTHIKIFGKIIHTAPAESSLDSHAQHILSHLPAASHPSNEESSSLPVIHSSSFSREQLNSGQKVGHDKDLNERVKWLLKYVDAADVEKYQSLLERMKIDDKTNVRRKFIIGLDDKEKEAIRNQDEQEIQRLLGFRGHLTFYAPEIYPEHLRPDEKRLEKLRMKQSKVKRKFVSGRPKTKGWYTDHTLEEAENIRRLTIQLHGKSKFGYKLNDWIRGLSPEERRKALGGDEQARYKLGPKLKPYGLKKKYEKNARMSHS